MRGLVNGAIGGGAIWLLVLAAGVLTRTYWLAWVGVLPLAALALLVALVGALYLAGRWLV